MNQVRRGPSTVQSGNGNAPVRAGMIRAIALCAVLSIAGVVPAWSQVTADTSQPEATVSPEATSSAAPTFRLAQAPVTRDSVQKTDWSSLLGPLGFGASGTDVTTGLVGSDTEQPMTGSSLSRMLTPRERYSLSWTNDGRLTLRFGMMTRETQLALPRDEVQAGAYYQITPRLRVGGAVKLQGDELSSKGLQDREGLEADVRLESAFKF